MKRSAKRQQEDERTIKEMTVQEQLARMTAQRNALITLIADTAQAWETGDSRDWESSQEVHKALDNAISALAGLKKSISAGIKREEKQHVSLYESMQEVIGNTYFTEGYNVVHDDADDTFFEGTDIPHPKVSKP